MIVGRLKKVKPGNGTGSQGNNSSAEYHTILMTGVKNTHHYKAEREFSMIVIAQDDSIQRKLMLNSY